MKKGHSAFQHTHLDRLLANLGVDQLLVTGGAVSGCVSDTVRMGGALGYESFVVTDALYPKDSPALGYLTFRAGFVSTADVLALDAGQPSAGAEPRSALLIVDMQNDFMQPDGAMQRDRYSSLSVAERDTIIANTRELIAEMRRRGEPVVFIRTLVRSDKRDSMEAPLGMRLRPTHGPTFEDGTWGAQLVDGLDPRPEDVIVTKKGHSAFGSAPLHRVLRNLGVKHCIVTGGAVTGCVSDTVREGVGLGYTMTIVSDATYPPNPSYLDVLKSRGRVCATAELLSGVPA